MKKHRILFVDDEIYILKGFARSTEDYLDRWEVDFANSGIQAIQKLSSNNFDAVISDMLMPGMDGLAFLENAQKNFPGTLRFILSGNSNDAQVIRSAHLVHQMFPKPSEMEHIYTNVERACVLKDTLSEPNLIRLITGIKTIPSVPTLYRQLIMELQSEEPDPKKVGDIIAQDLGMTAKILQLVNSAFFGLSTNISNPQRAVTILGINTTKALVLGIHIFTEFQSSSHFPISIDSIWKHSLLVSRISREIANDLHLSSQEQEDAQVSGILHDTGKLVEFQFFDFFERVRIEKGMVSNSSEYKAYGTSHSEIGAYLLGIWGLPNQIVEAVLMHHRPNNQISGKVNVITALHIANGLVNMCTVENKPNYDPYLDMAYLKKVGLINHLDNWTPIVMELTQTQSKRKE